MTSVEVFLGDPEAREGRWVEGLHRGVAGPMCVVAISAGQAVLDTDPAAHVLAVGADLPVAKFLAMTLAAEFMSFVEADFAASKESEVVTVVVVVANETIVDTIEVPEFEVAVLMRAPTIGGVLGGNIVVAASAGEIGQLPLAFTDYERARGKVRLESKRLPSIGVAAEGGDAQQEHAGAARCRF